MNPLTVAKLALAIAGLAIFGYGVRVDEAMFRWIGVAFVAAAWLLRFRRPKGEPPG